MSHPGEGMVDSIGGILGYHIGSHIGGVKKLFDVEGEEYDDMDTRYAIREQLIAEIWGLAEPC